MLRHRTEIVYRHIAHTHCTPPPVSTQRHLEKYPTLDNIWSIVAIGLDVAQYICCLLYPLTMFYPGYENYAHKHGHSGSKQNT